MSAESSPGKPNPATQPNVVSTISRAGMSAALQIVFDAPPQSYTHTTGGKNKSFGN